LEIQYDKERLLFVNTTKSESRSRKGKGERFFNGQNVGQNVGQFRAKKGHQMYLWYFGVFRLLSVSIFSLG
jgi:hypothetical protein